MMRRPRVAIVASLLALAPAVPAVAQSQQTCEDRLRTAQVLAEQYAVSRQRGEVDAAQTIAALLKQLEALRAEMERLKSKEGK